MLVETCLRKGLGLKAHRVVAVREDGDVIVAEIERFGRRRLRCSGCGGAVKHTAGRRPLRRWRDLRLRARPLVLAYQPYRVRCGRCGVRVEQVPWAAQWVRVTTALARGGRPAGPEAVVGGGRGALRPRLEDRGGDRPGSPPRS